VAEGVDCWFSKLLFVPYITRETGVGKQFVASYGKGESRAAGGLLPYIQCITIAIMEIDKQKRQYTLYKSHRIFSVQRSKQ